MKKWIAMLLITALAGSVPSAIGDSATDVRRPCVLSEGRLKLLADEVSGYAAFNNLRIMATYHRTLGSDDSAELLRRLRETCRRYGLDETKLESVPVRTGREFFGLQDFDGQVPTRVRSAELRLVGPYPKLITSTESAPSCLIQGSRAADVTAPVVFIGRGDDPANYEGKDLKGKLALAGNALPEQVKEMAIHRFGAAGLLFYLDIPTNSGDNPDANLNSHWSPWGRSGEASTFGFSLSVNQFRFLKGLLDRGEEVVVRARVDAELKPESESVFEILDAVIPGSARPEREFWIWAHYDHSLPGAVDNGSGCAAILEAARVLRSLVAQGHLPPPRRTIRFLWVPHVTGLYMYLSRHPQGPGRVLGGLSVDSVGVDQTRFSSALSLQPPSHSLPSFWTSVLESLVEHLQLRTNRDLLDYRRTDNLYAPEGSRDQYHVRMIPFASSGDEMQTNNSTVRIPTMAMSSIPVPPRHSQVNYLSYVDPTGLHRSSYLISALALAFGWTDADSVRRISDETALRGRTRLLREFGKAERALSLSPAAGLDGLHRRGRLLLECGLERELGMLESVHPLAEGAAAPLSRIEVLKRRTADFVELLTGQLELEYRDRCRSLGRTPAVSEPSSREARLDRLVPVSVPGIMGTASYFGNYYEKVLGRERLASFDLRPGFAYGILGFTEAHNFIDGRRSILEIHQAVSAELWSEGYPAMHDITLDEVERYMRMLEAAGVITITPRGGAK